MPQRSETLRVRLTPDEKGRLEAEAETAGVKLSELARGKLLGADGGETEMAASGGPRASTASPTVSAFDEALERLKAQNPGMPMSILRRQAHAEMAD